MSDEIYSKLIALIAEKLNVKSDQLQRDTEFIKELGADSLDLVELIADIELEFDLDTIPDDMAQSIKTVGDAYDRLMEVINQ
ncbi:MAG: acyl carrier protein [Candidatus Lernaella stagnicola]|nr:acyl carrier protein [Candidatus Lernaella stagnicola]